MSRMITQSTLTVGGVDLKTPPLPAPPRVTVGTRPSRLTVACVWWGTLYGVEYVEKLRDAVARNLTIPYDFVCITPHQNVPDGVIRMSPRVSGKGWWQKVGLFSPDLFGVSQRVLYLDLDLVVINSLDEIASSQEEFCMIENFGPNKGHAAHNSSCMLWTPSEKTYRIHDCFTNDVMSALHGDQCWIWRVMLNDITDFHQYQCVSYKYEKQSAQWRHRNENTACVVFHGKPKPHEVRDSYVVENW